MTAILGLALLAALPTARMQATPTRVTIGDPIAVEFEIRAPSGSTVTLHAASPADGFIRLWRGRLTERRDGQSWILRQREQWAAFRTGSRRPPPRAITIRLADGSSMALTAAWPAITVASVIPPGETHPSPAPYASPRTIKLFPWGILALAGGALAAIAAAVFLVGRRRRLERAVSALERFRAELERLETSSFTEEMVADGLAKALREYLSRRLGWSAGEWTSAEILAHAAGDPRGFPVDSLRHALRFSDRTRFARELSNRETARRAIGEARRVADGTEVALAPREASA
jgi:hypothetical protein